MHSNFITPPDFVDEPLTTITVVNATLEEVELLARMCENTDPQYNIYLYRTEMNDRAWLDKAVELSEAVIVNATTSEFDDLCDLENAYYYGDRDLIIRILRLDVLRILFWVYCIALLVNIVAVAYIIQYIQYLANYCGLVYNSKIITGRLLTWQLPRTS